MLAIAVNGAQAQPAGEVVPNGSFEGTWSWGSPRRSAEVPFLRISRDGTKWIVQTKHYMHDNFVSGARDVRVSGNRLEFSYWYEPLARWASCSLELADGKMAGACDGELNAREWGSVPAHLWRDGK